jgi:putative SOS response-associated peptidase YedK
MCGRLTLHHNWQKTTHFLVNEFGMEAKESLLSLPQYNLAPSQTLLVIIHDGIHYRIGSMKWGFTSPMVNTKPVINARGETIHEKPMFRQSFVNKRCMILASGFYEWDRNQQPAQPYWFYPESSPFMLIAGIYQSGTNKNGHKFANVCMLTTQANAMMQPIHNRLPVILNQDQYHHWVAPQTPVDELSFLFKSTNFLDLKMHPVTPLVNRASYQEKDAILAIKK